MPIIGALESETVSANFVDRLVRAAVAMGARRPGVLNGIGFSDAQLRNPVGRMPGRALPDLFATLVREFADPAIPFALASGARPQCFSDLGYVAMFAETVGDMLEQTIAIQGFRQNIWQVNLERDDGAARLCWTVPKRLEQQFAGTLEFSVASYVHLYRNSVAARPSPIAVRFSHRPRFAEGRYRQALQCPVHFGADRICIEFDADDLRLRSPRTNPALQRNLLQFYNQAIDWLRQDKSALAFCYLYLASELNKSPLTLDRAATALGMSERTLRRRLVAEGKPFRDLLEHVRKELYNLYRMENSRSMREIAELLGYAELSAFSRAHRKWYGEPPTQRNAII